MSYDEKFRRHVLKMREQEGLSFAKVAKRFGIAKQTVYYWTKRLEEKKKRHRMPQKLCLEALKRLGITFKKNSQSSQSGSRKAFYVLSKNR